MQLKKLFEDTDAVSPVIGVILMVAITVILAAVIGTFVLGLGSDVDSAPQANFQFEFDEGANAGYGDSDAQLLITHNGGDDIDASNVAVKIEGTEVGTSGDWTSSTISTGDSFPYTGSEVASDDTVRVIWQSPNGEKSSVIGSSTVPN